MEETAARLGSGPGGVERRGRLKVDRRKLENMLSEFDADTQDEFGVGALGDNYDDEALRSPQDSSETEKSPDRRQNDRQSMAHLRADYKWSVAPDVSGPAFIGEKPKLFGREGIFTPVRVFGLTVAVLAGAAAFYVSAQSRTAPPPVAEVETPAPEIVQEPRIKVLVARDAIAIGQRLEAGLVEWVDWPQSNLRSDYLTIEQMPNALEDMQSNVARLEILPGEPIREIKLVQAEHGFLSVLLEEGMRAVSVPVSADAAAGGFIRPNDHVDVVMTRSGPLGNVSETVLRNAQVLAINGQMGERAVRGGGAPDIQEPGADVFNNEAIATLALDPDRAEVLINAAKTGSLALVLRSIVDFSKSDGAMTAGVNQSIRLTSPFWNSQNNRGGPR